jgi:hypothetical protein
MLLAGLAEEPPGEPDSGHFESGVAREFAESSGRQFAMSERAAVVSGGPGVITHGGSL